MPRNISTALAAHIASGQTTLAKLFKITRVDGTVLGFTSVNQNITFGGVTYYASDGQTMSSAEQHAGTSIDNAEIMGLLSSSRITDADIAAKLYNGAAITISLVNYTDLTQGALIIMSGYLGQVTTKNGKYTVEVRGLEQLLKQRLGLITSPLCRCFKLGDACCKVNMSGNTDQGVPIRHSYTVSAVSSDGTQITFNTSAAAGTYAFGNIKFTAGNNTGLIRDVKTHTVSGSNGILTVRQAFPYVVQVGDTAQLEVGCDRNANTCNVRFSNLINFHGEPDLPGNNTYSLIGRG